MTDPNGVLRIAIIEDHELLAESLAFALRRDGVDPVVIVPTTADSVLGRVQEVEPALVLLDLSLGAMGWGIPLIPELRALGADVICVTGETSRATWGSCIEAGAVAIVSKSMPFEDLLARIEAVTTGDAPMSVAEREALLQAVRHQRSEERERLEPFERLTAREGHVLQELMDGRSAEAIATSSYVSLNTVRSQIRSILQKLGVGSQLAAVAMAVRAGWSPAPAATSDA